MACGASIGTATRAPSTYTSRRCARRSAHVSTSRPSAASDTASIHEPVTNRRSLRGRFAHAACWSRRAESSLRARSQCSQCIAAPSAAESNLTHKAQNIEANATRLRDQLRASAGTGAGSASARRRRPDSQLGAGVRCASRVRAAGRSDLHLRRDRCHRCGAQPAGQRSGTRVAPRRIRPPTSSGSATSPAANAPRCDGAAPCTWRSRSARSARPAGDHRERSH